MRKNKSLWLVIAVVLVVAMSAAVFMSCVDKGDDVTAGKPDDNQQTVTPDADDETPVNVAQITGDRFSVFALATDKSADEVKGLISVTQVGNATAVAVSVAEDKDGKIKIYPPLKGYEIGRKYKFTFGDGVAMEGYETYKEVRVDVRTDVLRKVVTKDGVLEFTSDAVIEQTENVTDELGATRGSIVLQTNNVDLEKGTTFFVTDAANNAKEAFKVETIVKNGSTASITYVKPELDEVFDELAVASNTGLESGDVSEIGEKDAERELENSPLATSVVELFGSKPEFNVNVNLADGSLIATVTITVPNVVKVDGFGNTDLTITVENVLTPTAETAINLVKDAKGAHFSFAVDANILNETSCRVTLGSSASYTKVENAQELLQKLTDLAAQSKGEEAGVAVPLFKWTVPIADGVASINYNADLAFRFAFSGKFDVEAKGSLNYKVGVSYNETDGLQAYSENLKDQFMDSIDVTMEGKAKIKVGVIQELGLDILAGVAGVGIKAELGNYNAVYGNFQTENLLDYFKEVQAGEDGAMVAGAVANLFFEGGFYYDVDLNFGLKIGSLLNLQQSVDIAAGEIRLYEAGSEYYALQLNKDNQSIVLDAFRKDIPTFTKQVYCMTSGAVTTEDVDPADLQFTVAEDAKIAIEGNKIVVKDEFKQQTFSETVNVKLVGGTALVSGGSIYETTMTVNYQSVFALENADVAYDKSNPANLSVQVYLGGDLTGSDVTLEGVEATFEPNENGGVLTIAARKLSVLENGVYTFTAKAGDLSAKLNVSVVGKVALKESKKADKVYEIYSADQVAELFESNDSYLGLTFQLSGDIDMKGAELPMLDLFEGTIEGEGYTISNYTVKNADGASDLALIKVNNGAINNVTFAGNVDFVKTGSTGKTYNVAGVALENKGTMKGVVFEGTINVTTDGLAAFITYNVAAGVVNGEGVDTQNAQINIAYKFDLANVTFNVSGAAAGNVGSKCGAGGGVITKVNVA